MLTLQHARYALVAKFLNKLYRKALTCKQQTNNGQATGALPGEHAMLTKESVKSVTSVVEKRATKNPCDRCDP